MSCDSWRSCEVQSFAQDQVLAADAPWHIHVAVMIDDVSFCSAVAISQTNNCQAREAVDLFMTFKKKNTKQKQQKV